MSSMTNFEEWLAPGNEPDDYEDAYALNEATNLQSYGAYEGTGDDKRMFIKGPTGDTLALVSSKAIDAFRRHIETFKDDPEMDWESWYGFKCAMAKDD